MKINKNDTFNLWDTNGRREDVLNAVKIYTNILYDLFLERTEAKWAAYPIDWMQYDFYKRAILSSPDVFKKHDKFDIIENLIQNLRKQTDQISQEKIKTILSIEKNKHILDANIEQRARHYTSNLVKLGFCNNDRSITHVGNALIFENITLDKIETLLPLSKQNIILLRQLMKLRIFSNDNKTYYSPFFMALYLLLKYKNISKEEFTQLIQLSNPYLDEKNKEDIFNSKLTIKEKINKLWEFEIMVPQIFKSEILISYDKFTNFIENRKQSSTVRKYYSFYSKLYKFVNNKTESNYNVLKNNYLKNKALINKAFFEGKTELDFGTNCTYNLETFTINNAQNEILNSNHFNEKIYLKYIKSKKIDLVKEYGDTTIRLLSATGIFKFNTPIPKINFTKIICKFIQEEKLEKIIFGKVQTVEKELYDTKFIDNISIMKILDIDDLSLNKEIELLCSEYETTESKLKNIIANETNALFIANITEKYSKEKVLEILEMFHDRKNDSQIKKIVSPSGDVPTIFEFVVSLTWYYISNQKMDIFNSLKLTMNGDFEPISHACGGDGDVIINYNDKSIMLEATLMNKYAQKKSEWEPVLRHSINNAKKNEGKDCFTFFIADELDFNTINIWRAVASVPLEATSSTGGRICGVTIMPFTIKEYSLFLKKNKSEEEILCAVKNSFSKVKQIVTENWRNEVLEKLN